LVLPALHRARYQQKPRIEWSCWHAVAAADAAVARLNGMTVQGGDGRGNAHDHAEQPARSPEIPPAEQPSPPSGYPPPGYEGRYAQQSETNAMAIGSLIASVVGLLVPFASIVGIVLGLVAINQIKKTRQSGYRMAVAGIVIAIATLVIYVIFAIHFRAHLPS
jgi:hypothetical protein